MPLPANNTAILRALVCLAVAQVIGWGTVSLPAVIGRRVAADLNMPVAEVFAGTSVLYIAMGLCAPILARAFVRFGARRVMIAGTVLFVPGFAILGFATNHIWYFLAWTILGAAGSATLGTAAYVCLNEIAGNRARSAIGALMLVTGLSNSVFWPTTAFLSDQFGWRPTCLLYAALTILVSLPIYVLGLPKRGPAEISTAAPANARPLAEKSIFYLIVLATSLNAFITVGFSAVLIELLRAQGLSSTDAIAFGSSLGVIQVGARAMDFFGGRRWDGVTTALIAGLGLPVSMLLLLTGNGTYWSILTFILCYGMSSGALAVARATIPLVFYDKAAYARAAAHIALPLNLVSALSPPLLAGLLTTYGSNVVLALSIVLSCIAFVILGALSRLRPQSEIASAS